MNNDKNPECPEGHGEMVPEMGEVKREKIEKANWYCETCGKIVTLSLAIS